MSNEQFCDPDSDSADRRFGQQLQSTARDERPDFSTALHARIMGAVVSSCAAETVVPAKPRRTSHTVASWAAIAAGLLIAVAGAFALENIAHGPQIPDPPRMVIVPPTNNLVAATEAPHIDFSFDDINQTAADAVRLVVDQLPIDVPTDGWDLSLRE